MKLLNIFAILLLDVSVEGVLEGANTSGQDWMVLLKHSLGGYCGGTLYSERVVITAAHCADKETRDWKAYPKLELRSQAGSRNHLGVQVLARYKHDLYEENDSYDVSVWLLKSKTNKRTKVVLGENTEFNDKSTLVYFMGWGTTNTVSLEDIERKNVVFSTVDQLQKAVVPLVGDETCYNRYPGKFTHGINFCAGEIREGPSAGYGDSGGPIYRSRRDEIVLMGVISNGIGCGYADYKDLNVKVTAPATKSFIEHYIKHISLKRITDGPFTDDIPTFKSNPNSSPVLIPNQVNSQFSPNTLNIPRTPDTSRTPPTPGRSPGAFSPTIPRTPDITRTPSTPEVKKGRNSPGTSSTSLPRAGSKRTHSQCRYSP